MVLNCSTVYLYNWGIVNQQMFKIFFCFFLQFFIIFPLLRFCLTSYFQMYHTSVVYLHNKCVEYHNYHICGNCVVQNGGTHYFSYLPSHPNFQYLIFQWVASTASSSLQQPPMTPTSSDSCSILQ